MGNVGGMDDPNRNLYCFGCGYNLRGLSGDPRRCPECAKLNAMADLEVPAERINRTLRRIQTGPALSTSAFLALILWLLPTLYVLIFPFSGYSSPPLWIWIFLISLIVLAAVGWVCGVFMFRSSCEARLGWVIALATFHFYGTLLAACGIATIAVLLWCVRAVKASLPYVPVLQVAGSGLFVVASAIAAPWLYKRAKATIAPLQRERAARLAREYLSTL